MKSKKSFTKMTPVYRTAFIDKKTGLLTYLGDDDKPSPVRKNHYERAARVVIREVKK